jgi:hypothetical protein
MRILRKRGTFFSFKVRRNFLKNNEKRVDFSDHSRKIHKKGVIFKEGNMFSQLKGVDFFQKSLKEGGSKSPLCLT